MSRVWGLQAQSPYLALADLAAELQGSELLQISSANKSPELGKELKLKCDVRLPTPQGCSWLFQKGGSGVKPTFLLYRSASRIKVNDELDANQFSGEKNGNEYTLTLKKFGKENQGYYFCSATGNSVVYFSPLLPVFLPGLRMGVPSPGCWGHIWTFSHTDLLLLNLLGLFGGYLHTIPISQARNLRFKCQVGLEVPRIWYGI